MSNRDAQIAQTAAELNDDALDRVAGGFLDEYTCTFTKAGGVGTRVEISLV